MNSIAFALAHKDKKKKRQSNTGT